MLVCNLFPVRKQLVGTVVRKDVAGDVRPRFVEQTGGTGEQFEPARKDEDVPEPVADQCNTRLEPSEYRPYVGTDLDLRSRQPSEAGVGGAFRQVAKLFALNSIEPQSIGESVDDRDRRVAIAALFDPDEVLDADPCQRGEFRAPQPGDSSPITRRDPECLGRGRVSSGSKEVAERCAHRNDPTARLCGWDVRGWSCEGQPRPGLARGDGPAQSGRHE